MILNLYKKVQMVKNLNLVYYTNSKNNKTTNKPNKQKKNTCLTFCTFREKERNSPLLWFYYSWTLEERRQEGMWCFQLLSSENQGNLLDVQKNHDTFLRPLEKLHTWNCSMATYFCCKITKCQYNFMFSNELKSKTSNQFHRTTVYKSSTWINKGV